MKPERAEELFSDYAEGTLTPALRLALEQHFAADPAARTDYTKFERVYSLLDTTPDEMVEVPSGFRAKILEKVAAEQARRETTLPFRAAQTVTGWFRPAQHKRLVAGGLAAVAALGLVFVSPVGRKMFTGGEGLTVTTPVAMPMPLIQRVDTATGQDGNLYHLFHVHLSPNTPRATVSAYVVTATDQITDPTTHLSEAIPALKQPQALGNDEEMQIPIAAQQQQPSGATLNLLVQCTTPNGGQQTEVVFTPWSGADPSVTAPVGHNFYDGLQAIAARYGVTVIADASSVPTQSLTSTLGANAGQSLNSLTSAVDGYHVQALPNNTFYVYKP